MGYRRFQCLDMHVSSRFSVSSSFSRKSSLSFCTATVLKPICLAPGTSKLVNFLALHLGVMLRLLGRFSFSCAPGTIPFVKYLSGNRPLNSRFNSDSWVMLFPTPLSFGVGGVQEKRLDDRTKGTRKPQMEVKCNAVCSCPINDFKHIHLFCSIVNGRGVIE